MLTLVAMLVSSSLLMLSLGIFSGMLDDVLGSMTTKYYGHILISSKGYQASRDLYAHLPLRNSRLEQIGSRPDILAQAPRLRGFGMLSSETESYPVEILGIDAEAERRVTTLGESRLPEYGENQRAPVALGRGLARRLDVHEGDELVFVTQAADGSFGNDLLQVSDIFDTGDPGHDNNLALVPLVWLQKLLVLPDRIHEVALLTEDALRANELARELQRHLPRTAEPELEILGWGELLPSMREAMASFDISRLILAIMLYSATGLVVLNTFYMAVMERTREFGIMLAIGMRPRSIMLGVMLETLMLSIVALALGTVLGALLCLYMAHVGIDLSGSISPISYAGGTISPHLRASFEGKNFWIPALVLLIVSLAAGLLPALKAARMNPVDALGDR